MITDFFEVAAGGVVGRDHLKDLGWRNNQDAYVVRNTPDTILAIVADGCSAAEQSTISHNEVGAHLGVRIVAEAILSRLQGEPVPSVWEAARLDALASIQSIARSMGLSFSRTIRDYFLFTLVGVLITPDKTHIFSIGDGVTVINGALIPIGPFPNNQPPYLSYSLVNSSIDPSLCGFNILDVLPTEHVNTIFIGTDGVNDLIKAGTKNLPGKEKLVGPLSQFWEEDAFFANPDQVRRRLALINNSTSRLDADGKFARYPGHLLDDTTLISIRRKKNKQEVS